MIKHFFTAVYRNFIRNKWSSLLTLANLVIGFMVFIFLSLIVNHELNFDKFNKNYDRIYRVQTKQEDSYPTNFCTYSPSALRYHLLADLPEIEKVLLMREISGNQGTGQYFTLPDGNQLYEKLGYWCENSIFDIFTIRIKEGNFTNALTDPNTIVITEKLEKKLFPKGGAVGKQVIMGKQYPLTVTAVIADFPANSDLKPSYLISMSTFETLSGSKGFRDNWTAINNDNFILLKKGADPRLVDAKIKDAFKNVKNFEKSTPYLRPLSKVHLSPSNQPDFYIVLSILSLAATLMLVLSCVNYVNLSLAKSSRRLREIGIKKVVGFSRKSLVVQFLGETLVITFLAMVIGLVMVQIASPAIDMLLQSPMPFNLFHEGRLLLIIASVSLLVGGISGLYPSLVISSYQPVKVLKGNLFQNSRKSINLKKVLIVSQFSITLFMLVISFIFHRQVNFMLNKDLGFRNKEILYSEVNFKEKVPFETIRTRLLQHPEIVDASHSNTIPFLGNIGGYITWDNAQPDEKVMISRNYINYDFISTFDLKIIHGRNFSREYPSDNLNCVVNETALKVFGWDDPAGKQIYLEGKAYPVVGVVKDFHPFTLHMQIPTYVMFLKPDVVEGSDIITVRYTPGNKQKAKQIINTELGNLIPGEAFEFKPYDELLSIDIAIRFWQLIKRIFIFFAVVTIFVSSMGLLGLIIFSIQRRTKEIGIRKILGSTVPEIYRQLSNEVLVMLGISVVFAFPAAIFIYKNMPGAYKEPLSVFEFLAAFGIVVLISILTISYHVLKVAFSNPVEALRYE